MNGIRVASLVAATGVYAAGAAALKAPATPTALVIITLDTTRADCLPAYGFGGVWTEARCPLAAACLESSFISRRRCP